MRKALSCVLMMTLLLAGCKAGGSGEESPEQLAAVIRGEYLSMAGWSADVKITAEYDEKVYDFTVDVLWGWEGESVLTITEPELLAGITARLEDGKGTLEYDGAGLSLGLLDEDGLTPLAVLPALMEHITTGYMARCAWEGEEPDRALRVCCRDPERAEGEGTEYTLWFDAATHALMRAEVSVDGATRLRLELTDFTMEMTQDDTGDHADLG